MKNEELRQVPRFPLPKEKMKFVFERTEKIFAVRDISLRGVGINLLEFGESLLFPEGHRCQAELKLAGEPSSVQLRVARVNAWSVGFTFEELPATLKEELQAFIDPMHIAQSLQAVNPRGAPEAFAQGLGAWYHGDSGADLYLWFDSKKECQRALFCHGHRFWEWDAGEGVATGTTQPQAGEKLLFQKDATPDPRSVDTIRKVLEHVQVLDYRLASFLRGKT